MKEIYEMDVYRLTHPGLPASPCRLRRTSQVPLQRRGFPPAPLAPLVERLSTVPLLGGVRGGLDRVTTPSETKKLYQYERDKFPVSSFQFQMTSHNILFLPLDKTVSVESGTSLLEAAGKAGILINSACGGDGICGRCKMIVKEGKVSGEATMLLTREEIRQGVVLACQSHVESDLIVTIPEETRAGERVEVDEDAQRFRAIRPGITQKEFTKSPLVFRIFLKLEQPTLQDNLADCQRIQRMVKKATGISSMQTGLKIVQRLPQILRENDFAITATIGRRRDIAEVMDIEGGDSSGKNYMVIVDTGTSTIVAHLVNIVEMITVDAQACFNSQSVYGREVTARIMAAEKKGAKPLQKLVVEDINRLISTLATKNRVSLKDITEVVCSGNTTMTHFLLGLPAGNLRRNPYIAANIEPPPFRAAEVGIKINPRGLLFAIPGISSWVGGDVAAGILATGLHEMEETAMLIDIGTNGEIVIGNKEWLMACSASTGPALEGASVKCGMMAEKGAIEKIYIEDEQLRYKVIGNTAPKGICGSGIIDLVAVLLDKGIIDRAGKFVRESDPLLKFENGRGKFFVTKKGKRSENRDIYVTQDDIDNVITAKAAVFAATKIMLDRLNLEFSAIKRIFLAGGFGSYINRINAIKIGLLPDLPISKIQYVGNTSIWGAKLAALSEEAYDTLREIREKTTYYDLMGSTDYVEQFKQAMFLPHTNIEMFPSVRDSKGQ